jgi:DNA replication protein DnaC
MGRKKITRYAFNEDPSQEERIKSALKLLELEGCANVLSEINKISLKEKLKFYDSIERLLEEELNKREDLRIERWRKQAKFPRINTIEEYDFRHPDSIDEKQVRELVECRWINVGWNVTFLGPSGVGKTHLSIALGLKAIEKNFEVRFTTIDILTDQLKNAIAKDEAEGRDQHRKKLLASLVSVPVLIIDEIAYTPMSDAVRELFRQIILRRHEARKSIITTANTPPSEWGRHFGDDNIRNSALIDRLLDGIRITIKGESYRFKNSKKY